MSWRDDATPNYPMVSLAQIGDYNDAVGESATFTFQNDGKSKDTENGEATVFHAVAEDVPDGFTDMNDEPVEEGDEVNIMTSSNTLLGALAEAYDNLAGETVEISAEGDTDSFNRTYSVE